MKWARTTLLAAATVSVVTVKACSFPDPCIAGITPYPGQSDVPVDAVIEIRRDRALPRDLPSLDGDAVGLMTADGESVEVDVEIDFDFGIVRLVPTRPLEPDQDYVAWGLDEDTLNDQGYTLQRLGELPIGSADTWFHTGPQLAVLELLGHHIVFSEPVDPSELDGKVRAFTGAGEDLGVVTVADREPSFELALALPAGEASYLLVGAGVVAVSGAELVTDVEIEIELDGSTRDVYSGEPVCGPDQ
jgi:hypothetical protein